MSDPKSPQPPNENPSKPPSDPAGGPKDPAKPDPCDEPTPPEPPPPEPPPCPPPEDCPPPKGEGDCPKLPELPPDPCADKGHAEEPPPGDQGQQTPQQQTPSQQEPSSPEGEKGQEGQPGQQYQQDQPDQQGEGQQGQQSQQPRGGQQGQPSQQAPQSQQGRGGAAPAAADPAAHLAALKARLEDGQQELQRLEPLKSSLADLAQRIQALEKAVDGQAAATSAYKEFYRTTAVARNEIKGFIPTVRCQLELTDKQKACICKVIEGVDARVAKARRDSAAQNASVDRLEARHKRAVAILEWIRKWYEFLKGGLQQQVARQRDDLKALKALADPAKDQCEVYFHLYEMERLIDSKHGGKNACWQPDLTIGTFLDCWPWECYSSVWNKAIVEFNEAEAAEKMAKSELEQARKRAADLEKIAKEADAKRREWILKEIKAECCGPLSKCP
jgi:hypothetical protein